MPSTTGWVTKAETEKESKEAKEERASFAEKADISPGNAPRTIKGQCVTIAENPGT